MKCDKIVSVHLTDWETHDKVIHFLLTRDIEYKISYPDDTAKSDKLGLGVEK